MTIQEIESLGWEFKSINRDGGSKSFGFDNKFDLMALHPSNPDRMTIKMDFGGWNWKVIFDGFIQNKVQLRLLMKFLKINKTKNDN